MSWTRGSKWRSHSNGLSTGLVKAAVKSITARAVCRQLTTQPQIITQKLPICVCISVKLWLTVQIEPHFPQIICLNLKTTISYLYTWFGKEINPDCHWDPLEKHRFLRTHRCQYKVKSIAYYRKIAYRSPLSVWEHMRQGIRFMLGGCVSQK